MPQVALQIVIAIVLEVIALALTPEPTVTYPSVKDAAAPTADAGRPIPVLFGKMEIKGLNVLGYWDKETYKSIIS